MGTAVEVLWWLVPPVAATFVAMIWAAWLGRQRDDEQRDDSDAALARMGAAIARAAPRRPVRSVAVTAPDEPTHGVAIRGKARRPPPRKSAGR